MSVKDKIKKNLNTFSIIFALLGLLTYFWGFKLYVYSWHLLNSNPIIWGNLKIKIPSDLILDEVKSTTKSKIIKLHNYNKNFRVAIYFAWKKGIKSDYSLTSIYKQENFSILERKACNFFDKPCEWFTGQKQENNTKRYREDIFLKSQDIFIFYVGEANKRYFLEEVISNLTLNK
jgi:hypothetical protein